PRQDLGQRLADLLLLEGDGTGEGLVVASHRGQVDPVLEQPLRELAGAVGPEVEEDRGVQLVEQPRPAADRDRLDELVGYTTLVARLDSLDRIVRLHVAAQTDGPGRGGRACPGRVP